MAKARINELARELEVKARTILDYLAEIGVEEKKSHSSSIEEELAEKVRAHFRDHPEPASPAPSAETQPIPEEPPTEAHPPAEMEPAKAGATMAAKSIPSREAPVADAKTAVPLRRPAPGESARALPRRPGGPLRPPIRPHVEPTAPAAAVLAPESPLPGAMPPSAGQPSSARPTAAAEQARRTAAPASSSRVPGRAPGRPAPPLGPAKPGEPIYSRKPPLRPGGRAPAAPSVPVEASRRGPHPVRGRLPHAPPAHLGRQRPPEASRERPLREMQRPRAAAQPIVVDREVTITEGITVKDLSEKLGVKSRDLIRRLLDTGVLATINQNLDPALAEQVSRSFGAQTRVVSFEEAAEEELETVETPGKLVARAPVVTVMGHVDHGKTSLLDAIREANVTAQEAGGITQHIGAYTVSIKDRRIVFLDTPGHEAFTQMRARGAKVTDIVVLVVAADDGVMPQTIEAINHARAAKVPILVAVNKIDKPGAQPERVMQQLGDRGLVPEKWGGDTVMVEVSAKQRTNLELLLEMILLVADLQELKANPERPAIGTVLESKLDKGRGPVCTVLVQNGTLHVGDSFLVGPVFGKVRAMLDDRGRPLEEAPPATPVEVLGLASLPQVGDQFQAGTDPTKAKQIALYRGAKLREASLAKTPRLTLDQLHDQMRAGAIKELPIVLKADVQGSAEVLSDALSKLGDERVKTKIIHAAVGAITISDVLLASASNSIIIGFSVRPERKAVELAQQENVDIRLHTIIYEVVDEIKKAMTGLLEPVHREIAIGKAEVRQTFRVSKVGMVAGSVVAEGRLTRGCSVRLLRDNVVVHEGRVASLRRFKDDVQEVKSGLECGIVLENFNDIKVGDVIEAFVTERVATEALA
ncbi:MAG: translation initiation factor IF-2 [Acidobacteria bacterium]|nr:translation initiation factor IF-2 [Acidobacteriota bacterium]